MNYSEDPSYSTKPFVNKFKETQGGYKWDCHSTQNGWYGMNYPRSLNKQWYKKNNDLNFQNIKPVKNNNSAFQSEMKMKLPLLQGVANEVLRNGHRTEYKEGQYHQLKKSSHFTLTTAQTDYKKELLQKNSIGYEHQVNINPISEKITEHKPESYEKVFLDLIWRIGDVKKVEMVLDYKNDDIRHYAHVGDQTMTNQTQVNILSDELMFINFVNNKSVSNKFLSKIGYHAANLQGLELSGTLIDDESQIELYDSLNDVVTLKVSNCPNITSKSLTKIINEKCKQLKYITLAHMDHAVDDNVIEKMNKCNLHELDQSYCNSLSSEALANFAKKSTTKDIEVQRLDGVKNGWSGETLQTLIDKNMHSLKVISLVNFSMDKWSSLPFKAMSNCFNIEQLYLNNIEGMNDEALGNFNKDYDSMQVLSTTMLPDISDSYTIKIPLHCGTLDTVNLTGLPGLTEEKLTVLIKACPSIKTIICNQCSSQNDKAFAELVEENPKIQFIRNLSKPTPISETGLRVWLPRTNAPRPGDKKKGKKKK